MDTKDYLTVGDCLNVTVYVNGKPILCKATVQATTEFHGTNTELTEENYENILS